MTTVTDLTCPICKHTFTTDNISKNARQGKAKQRQSKARQGEARRGKGQNKEKSAARRCPLVWGDGGGEGGGGGGENKKKRRRRKGRKMRSKRGRRALEGEHCPRRPGSLTNLRRTCEGF